jgi:hypothetical protein
LTSTDEPFGFSEDSKKKKNFSRYQEQFKEKRMTFIVLYSEKRFILKGWIVVNFTLQTRRSSQATSGHRLPKKNQTQTSPFGQPL